MEKMKFETEDLSQKNVEQIGAIFPNCIRETKDKSGKLKKAINFEILKQLLSDDIVNEGDEAYEFTWVGKKDAMVEANKPIRKTLRPCKEESKDWDNTENLYIEGDNFEVLRLLQESYLNSVNMIYVDPPYNTGDDILYKNDYKVSTEKYEESLGITDAQGNILYRNTDTNGRFHSDWCSMMYSRLVLARNLLRDDGFIAIAIDHNELFNLGKICDEVFGGINRIGIISVVHKPEGRNQAKFIGPSNEYMLIYAKNQNMARMQNVVIDPEIAKKYDRKDKIGRYRLQNFIRMTDGKLAYRDVRPKFWYPIYVNIDTQKMSIKKTDLDGEILEIYPKTKVGVEMSWKVLPDTADKLIKEGNLVISADKDGFITIMEKIREMQVIKTHWIRKEYNAIQYGTKIITDLFGGKTFDFPKSLYLVEDTVKLFSPKDGIIMDFFSGSATTAHAVMELNAEDGGNRKFIMVQVPQVCDEKSEAYKAGYKNICEIGKERIRRAGEKIKADNADKEGIEKLDTGFRVLKVDDTNMKDVYYTPDEYSQKNLFDMESNIKEDRTELDLLYGCLIDWGIPLDCPYESREIDGCSVHIYSEGDLVACFDEEISEEAIKGIAKMEPLRVVFRDSSFKTSADKINVEEIFKLLSPETSIRVL